MSVIFVSLSHSAGEMEWR